MTTFRHTHQLRQLKTIDRPAYTRALALVDRRAFGSAAVVIKAAMRQAFDRLTAPALVPAPLYDLVIAVTKYGYGATCNGSEPIKWLKFAGQPKQVFHGRKVRLTDREMQTTLQNYELVDTTPFSTEVVFKYRKAQQPAFPGDGGMDSYDHLVIDKNSWPYAANAQRKDLTNGL